MLVPLALSIARFVPGGQRHGLITGTHSGAALVPTAWPRKGVEHRMHQQLGGGAWDQRVAGSSEEVSTELNPAGQMGNGDVTKACRQEIVHGSRDLALHQAVLPLCSPPDAAHMVRDRLGMMYGQQLEGVLGLHGAVSLVEIVWRPGVAFIRTVQHASYGSPGDGRRVNVARFGVCSVCCGMHQSLLLLVAGLRTGRVELIALLLFEPRPRPTVQERGIVA
mmetsp:Transcript_11573/g.29178  ORF Transcript_11573/g.29178 Transcript_11573/m.29178 type:complete len:221 (+) Transcript_11573:4953-5615(+)